MLCTQRDPAVPEESVERLRGYAAHLVLDVLALRRQLRSQLEQARLEHEQLLDMLDRALPHLAASAFEDEGRALLDEIADALTRRR
jgi:hypothetical protein